MDKVSKALQNLSAKEKGEIKKILLKIKNGSLLDCDLKKLKNTDDIFRVRKGKWRVIFKKHSSGQFFVLAIERRSDKTIINNTNPSGFRSFGRLPIQT